MIDGGIGFGYLLGRKWCKLCHLWYPDEQGNTAPSTTRGLDLGLEQQRIAKKW